MYSTLLVLAALILSSALVVVAVKPRKPSWKDHPVILANPSFKPPILVWYTTRNDPSDNGEQLYAWGRFTPRGSRFHLLGSAHKDNADKYKNWDMLELAPQGALRDDWLTFEIARDATMCIVYGISGGGLGNVDAMISTPGFSPVGVVKTPSSADLPSDRKYSDYHGKPVAWGFLACRQVKAGIQHMPHKDKLNVGGVWGYNLIFGEPNGKSPPLPKNPPGFGVTPIAGQAFCPPALHAMWQVRSNTDPLTKNLKFAGWHPQVDPIYKCHYGHEHGSPGILAGFVEEMNYTAYKYHDQDEFHPGFKGYVIPVNDKFLYLNAHTETTLKSRIDEPAHTVVIAITDRDTGEVQMQLNCKAHFGPSFAEYNSGSMPAFPAPAMMPVGGPDNKRMIDKMYSPKNYFARKINGKRINIYNPDSPDSRLRYENEDPLLGLYEKWTGGGSGQMCFSVAQPYVADGISFDIKDADTGCSSVDCSRMITLGQKRSDQPYFYPSRGANREVIFRQVSFGEKHCSVKLPRRGPDGVFYTSNDCKTIKKGPGPDSVQQIMKPGVSLSIHGAYALNDIHGTQYYQLNRQDPDDFSQDKHFLRGFKNIDGGIGEGGIF